MPEPLSVTVARLSRHPELVPLVASWLRAQWPAWYGPAGNGDAEQDALRYAQAGTALPLGLVVFVDAVPVGFGALKNDGVPPDSVRGPWAGAGYVRPESRRQGIGALLLLSLVQEAMAMGYSRVFCGTRTASSLLVRQGWQKLDVVAHGGEQVDVFQSAASLTPCLH